MQTLSGTDTYEWLGRFFVIHHADVMAGEDHVQNLEMVGPYDGERGTFLTSVYDAATGEVERSIASVDDAGVWSFRAGEGASRGQSTLRVDEDGQHMHGAWSRTEDGGATWWPWRRFDPHTHTHVAVAPSSAAPGDRRLMCTVNRNHYGNGAAQGPGARSSRSVVRSALA